jgi:hypothetical protein
MIPFTAGCLWTESRIPPEHVSTLLLQVAAILPLLALGIYIVFGNDVREELRRRGFFGGPKQDAAICRTTLDTPVCKT